MFNKIKMLMNLFPGGGGVSNGTPGGANPYGDTGDLFHNFMNKISRLPRLVLLFGAIALLIWPLFDPIGFTAWATAVKHMPENVWILIFMVIGSWATSKFIRDVRSPSSYTQYSSFSQGYSENTHMGSLPKTNYVDIIDDDIDDGAVDNNNAIRDWKKHANK